ncbi:MAG: polyphenol oxidase family protein [Chlamydiae bacterium]|nr:polyphenol oxidase family protein [Chlamydiota bacterium]
MIFLKDHTIESGGLKSMIKMNGALCWMEFEKLQKYPQVKHAIFLKPSDTALLDDTQRFLSKVITIMGFSTCDTPKMNHGNVVLDLSESLNGAYCDGIYTDKYGKALRITHADCQAAIFFDPRKNIIANVHCGWRGNVQNIYKNTILQLNRRYGSMPADLIVCISPSLGPENAEFVNYKHELPEYMWEFQKKTNYFDLWEISKYQLESSGVLSENIEIASICTFDNPDQFFSYRRDKTKYRNSTIVGLKETP